MLFKISYIFLLIAFLLLGQVYIIGPISVRYVAVILMLIICFTQRVRYPYNNRFVLFYLIYIFIIFLTSLYHGYIADFLKFFVGYFLATLVFVWATCILIRKYKSPKFLLYTLVVFCLANAIVTILQYNMNPIGLSIAYFLNVFDTDVGENMIMKMSRGITDFVMPGIVGAVPNGYFSSVGTVLALYGFYKKKNISSLIIWAVIFYGLIIVQERAGLIAGIAGSLLVFYYTYKRLSKTAKLLTILFLLFLIAVIFVQVDFTQYIEGTRYNSFDFDSRTDLYIDAHNYLTDNIFVANMLDFYDKYKIYPHNLFYNAFIYGSLFGGVIMLYVLVLMLCKTVFVLRKRTGDEKCHITIFACAFIAYTICSLTHNASILSGDILGWLLIVPILIEQKDRQSYNNTSNC